MVKFPERNSWGILNGETTHWNNANIHILTHSFQYGGGAAFEGERAYEVNGKPVIFRSEEHSVRLLKSAELIGLETDLRVDDLEMQKYAVLEKNGFSEAYVRANIWRDYNHSNDKMAGVNPIGTGSQSSVFAWQDWTEVPNRSMLISQWERASPKATPVQAKINSYTASEQALVDVNRTPGFNDAVMKDFEGYIAEGATANIFFLSGGKLYTPKADRFLNGITRQTAIAIARKEGYEIDYNSRINLDQLLAADEVFVTGTAIEIVGVERIGEKRFPVGALTKTFRDAYQDLVHSDPKTVQEFVDQYGGPDLAIG